MLVNKTNLISNCIMLCYLGEDLKKATNDMGNFVYAMGILLI